MAYTRVHRLLRIIALAQSGAGWSAERLARACATSKRNIYRDMDQLRTAGVPIAYDKKPTGYRVGSEFFLPPVHLTAEEALALALLCEEIAFLTPAWRALSKIESQLPADLREEVCALRGHVAIRTAAASPPDGCADVYERMQAAIATRCALECRYEAAASTCDDGWFYFEPYALFFGVRAWYAIGRRGGRDGVRSLKLRRFAGLAQQIGATPSPTTSAWTRILGTRGG